MGFRGSLVPLLTLALSTVLTAAKRPSGGTQNDLLSGNTAAPEVLLTAVSDGVEEAFAETREGAGTKLFSTTVEQDIRPYNSSSAVPFCHECFGRDISCRVCLHGEHESSVSY